MIAQVIKEQMDSDDALEQARHLAMRATAAPVAADESCGGEERCLHQKHSRDATRKKQVEYSPLGWRAVPGKRQQNQRQAADYAGWQQEGRNRCSRGSQDWQMSMCLRVDAALEDVKEKELGAGGVGAQVGV